MRPGEAPAVAWSWAYIFSILASYYMLRPIRDQIRGLVEDLLDELVPADQQVGR